MSHLREWKCPWVRGTLLIDWSIPFLVRQRRDASRPFSSETYTWNDVGAGTSLVVGVLTASR
jgi:hypothetical protein